MREGLAQRQERHKHACDGSPQPDDQQHPQYRSEYVGYCGSRRHATDDRNSSFRNQSDTRHKPHQQKAEAGQTVGERRVKASQIGAQAMKFRWDIKA